MNIQLQTEALLAAAEAFLARGSAIQYDQRSMDRILRVTPRRNKLATPESATAQHTLFLDCSSFVNAVYHTAFGTVLEADLTWHMAQLVSPCVFRWQTSQQDTMEERLRIIREVTALIQPGDVLVLDRGSASHVLLIGRSDMFYHCAHKGAEKGYRYDTMQEAFAAEGAIYRESLSELLEPAPLFDPDTYHIFDGTVDGFCVLRPLARLKDPTGDALARLGTAHGLYCSVLSSHPGGKAAAPGETITYTVQVRDLHAVSRTVSVRFAPPDGSPPQSALLSVPPNGVEQAAFSLTVPMTSAPFLDAPAVIVNGLSVWAERILLHRGLSLQQYQQVQDAVYCAAEVGTPLMAAIQQAYAPLGIRLPPTASESLTTCFQRYDAVGGDVLWRLPQQPACDASLYGFFGGTGVITPEATADSLLRTKRITPEDLSPGDVILCGSDARLNNTSTYFRTADGLLEDRGHGINTLHPRDVPRLIESLPGQFCYLVLRPSAAERSIP